MNSRKSISAEVSPLVYSGLCDIAGSRLAKPVFASVDLQDLQGLKVWSDISKAVYIVLDTASLCAYVGSVDRSGSGGLANRISEHSKLPNRSHWARAMVLPLRSDLSEQEVRKVEGEVGRRLRPYDNEKLPS